MQLIPLPLFKHACTHTQTITQKILFAGLQFSVSFQISIFSWNCQDGRFWSSLPFFFPAARQSEGFPSQGTTSFLWSNFLHAPVLASVILFFSIASVKVFSVFCNRNDVVQCQAECQLQTAWSRFECGFYQLQSYDLREVS